MHTLLLPKLREMHTTLLTLCERGMQPHVPTCGMQQVDRTEMSDGTEKTVAFRETYGTLMRKGTGNAAEWSL